MYFQSDSLFGSISSVITEILVVSITRFMNNTQAITNPTSMATVKSKITVRKKVISRTATSDLGFSTILEHSPSTHVIGNDNQYTSQTGHRNILCQWHQESKISNNTTACTIPATGDFPPLLIFVMVRAIAPVAGIPPNIGDTKLAIPCAISSVFESWRSPITPSATAAESKDSMAPNTAIVMATGNRFW